MGLVMCHSDAERKQIIDLENNKIEVVLGVDACFDNATA